LPLFFSYFLPGTLCFIFVPKIKFKIKGLEEGVGFGESIMRESHRRASTREISRRSFAGGGSSQFGAPMGAQTSLAHTRSSLGISGADSIIEETDEDLIKDTSSRILSLEPSQPSSAASTDRSTSNYTDYVVNIDLGNGENSSSEVSENPSVRARAAMARAKSIENAKARSRARLEEKPIEMTSSSHSDVLSGIKSDTDEMGDRMKQHLIGSNMGTLPKSPVPAPEGVVAREQQSQGASTTIQSENEDAPPNYNTISDCDQRSETELGSASPIRTLNTIGGISSVVHSDHDVHTWTPVEDPCPPSTKPIESAVATVVTEDESDSTDGQRRDTVENGNALTVGA
jgi:hypothetical protein